MTFSEHDFKYSGMSRVNKIKYSNFFNSYIAASFEDGSIKLFDTSTSRLLNNFSGFHSGSAQSICFSPINKLFLCSVGMDCKINFYDIQEKKHLKVLTTEAPLTSIAFNSDGQTIAVGNINGSILLYDLRYWSAAKATLNGHDSQINHIEFAKKMKISNNSKLETQSVKSNKSVTSIDKLENSNYNYNLNSNKIGTNENKKDDRNLINSNKISNNKVNEINTINPASNVYITKKEELNNNFVENVSFGNNLLSNKKNEIFNLKGKNSFANTDKFTSENERNDKSSYEKTKQFSVPNKSIPNLNLDQLDNKTETFIKNCIEAEIFKLKQYIHEEINSLHVDLIRQFQIQHSELIKSLKNFSLVNNKMATELEKLQKENKDLKSKLY